MTDITLKVDNGYFSYKVGAIIIHENKLLMVKSDNYSYYYPVGGRVMFGETSETAVLRETFEETGIHFQIDRLAFLHENCFVATFLNNVPCHEIGLYYLMNHPDDIGQIGCDSSGIDGGKESLHWLPLDELSSFYLFPEFYKTELQKLQHKIGHFITKNEKTFRVN